MKLVLCLKAAFVAPSKKTGQDLKIGTYFHDGTTQPETTKASLAYARHEAPEKLADLADLRKTVAFFMPET